MIKQLRQLLSFSLLATGCTFVLQTLATHLFQPADYGLFARWLTDISFYGVFFVLGLDNAILYFSKTQDDFARYLLRNIAIFTLLFFVYVCFTLILWGVDKYHLSLAFVIYMFAIYQTVNASNQHSQRYRTFGFFTFLRPFVLLLPFLGLFVAGIDFQLAEAFVTYTCGSAFLVCVISIFWVRRFNIKSVSFKASSLFDRKYLLYGLKGMTNTLLAISLYSATIYSIGFLSTPSVVAFFFVAAGLSKLAWILPDVVGNILYPKFLRIGVDETEADVVEQSHFLAQIVFLVNIVFFCLFVTFGEWLIELLYDPAYADVYLPTCILLLGNQGMVFYKLLSRYFAAKNCWSVSHSGLLVGILTNVSLNFILVPEFGVVGAAVATSLSFWTCGLTVAFRLKGSTFGFINVWSLFKRLAVRCT